MRRRLPPTLLAGGLLVGLVVLTALVSAVWTPADPTHVEVGDRLKGPMPGYLLGTDQVGRDELSRLMAGRHQHAGHRHRHGGHCAGYRRAPGGLAALYRGRLEDATMRLSDVLLAFPAILLAILFAAGVPAEPVHGHGGHRHRAGARLRACRARCGPAGHAAGVRDHRPHLRREQRLDLCPPPAPQRELGAHRAGNGRVRGGHPG